MRTLGLIGGLSWESTAIYYRQINEGVRARIGGLHSASLILWSFDFAPLADAQHDQRWDEIAAALGDAAVRLEAAGAEGVVLCTNSMHRVADRISAAVSVPFLHIADGVIHEAGLRGIRRLGLLGTRFTMEAPFLKDRFAAAGFDVLVPELREHLEIHRIIYEELCLGRVLDSSRGTYLATIAQLRARGAEAVILGCTEISMLINQHQVEIPLLDTTELHARRATNFALGHGK